MGTTNGLATVAPEPVSVASSLLSVSREHALVMAAGIPARELAVALSGLRKPSELAALVACLPVDRVALVLVQDNRVFEAATPFSGDEDGFYDDAEGRYQSISHIEAQALIKAGQTRWLVPTERGEFGVVMKWGMRNTLDKFIPGEAFDRLEAILESENDLTWKYAALRALPRAYIALALRYAEEQDEHHAEALARAIERVVDACLNTLPTEEDGQPSENFAREIEHLRGCEIPDLYTLVHEAREMMLAQATQMVIDLTDRGVQAMADVADRGSVSAQLAAMRALRGQR